MSMRETLVAQAEKQGADSYVAAIGRLPANLVGIRARVREILISPVKSLAMMNLPCTDVRENGLAIMCWKITDRQVMLVRRRPGTIRQKKYEYVRFSQREAPWLIHARQSYGHSQLVLEAHGLPNLLLGQDKFMSQTASTCDVLMSKKSAEIVRCVRGFDELTDWIRVFIASHDSEFPVDEVEAVWRPANDIRKVDAMHACGLDARTDFSDGGMVTVASQASLDLINSERPGLRRITPDALRMNIVFDTDLPAYAEDVIESVIFRPGRGTPLVMRFGGLCVRCSVPCVDPASTDKETDLEFLGWLGANRPYRPDPDPAKKASGATLGVNCAAELRDRCNYINVGDEIEILSEK